VNDQMQPFSLLIKPASADCNLKCTYCFYIDKCKMYRSAKVHRMNETVLGRAISSYLRFNQKVYSFGWQGGEPTLMGLDFFKQVVSLQNTYLKPGAQITNGLQTNGTLLNDDWARFFSRNAFLVGVSLDGPEKIHNTYRTAIDKKGSYSSVIKGIGCLKRYKTQFNILTLISQANVHKPLDVYRFLRDEIDCLYHQYIECVEFDKTDNLTDFSITGQQWGDFLCTIFDEWVNNDTNRVSVRLFDSIIVTLLHKSPAMCTFGRDCRHYLVVEHNGDVYPCDFYVEEEMKLGNIIENDWSDLLSSPEYEMFGQRKGSYGHECDKCPFVDLCAGDCQKNRLTRTAIPHSKSVLCEGWKQFYEHSMPSFRKLIRKLENKKARNNQIISSSRPIGRNDPCPCGSGRKYKKCCMNN
jgi:uncharacterized protein